MKRTTDGYASNWLCDHVRPGGTLRVLPPSGIFTPASLDADLLLSEEVVERIARIPGVLSVRSLPQPVPAS